MKIEGKKKGNVLYISYDGMTDNLGMSQVLPYLKGLAANGHEFILISFEKKENYHKKKAIIEEFIGEANIKWYPLTYHKSPPILSTLYDMEVLRKKVKQLLAVTKIDFIHCRSYLSSLVALRIKREYGIPFIFDMRGFWADERVDGGLWNQKNWIYRQVYRFFKRRETEFLKESKRVVSLTHVAREEIISWKVDTVTGEKIKVIPCCADLGLFSRMNPSIEKNVEKVAHIKTLLNEKYVVSYLGSLGTWYMLEEMLSFFSVLKNKKKNAKFLMITPDVHVDVEGKAKKYGIGKDEIILVSASRKEVPALLSLSDFSLYFIKPVYSKISSSPTKLAEIMGMGIPVVTNRKIGDTDLILDKSGAGVLIEDFKEKEYEKAIDSLLAQHWNPELISSIAHRQFSLETGVELYEQIYKEMYEK